MVELNFDSTEVEPTQDFDVIPEGKYLAVITGSEEKTTKKGDGKYVQFAFQIVEGEHKNRYLWSRLNLENPNLTAVNIAKAELASICNAVGVLKPQESSELHDIPLYITVKVKKREDTGDLTNEIKKYENKKEGETETEMKNKDSGKRAPWAKNKGN